RRAMAEQKLRIASTGEAGTSGDACCGGSGCCGEVSRRDFVATAGIAAALGVMRSGRSSTAGVRAAFAGQPATILASHAVPAEKGLDAGWIRALFEPGQR